MIKRADTAGLGACRLSCSGEAIRRCQFWALHSNTWIKSVKSLWQNRISDPVRKQPLEKLSKIRMEVKLKWGAEKCQPFRFNSNLFSLQQITHSTATSFPPLIFPPGWDQPCAFCLFGGSIVRISQWLPKSLAPASAWRSLKLPAMRWTNFCCLNFMTQILLDMKLAHIWLKV